MAEEKAQGQSPSGLTKILESITSWLSDYSNNRAKDYQQKSIHNAIDDIRSELLKADAGKYGNKDHKIQKVEVEEAAGEMRNIAQRLIKSYPNLKETFSNELEASQAYLNTNTNKLEITHSATGLVFDREGFAAFLNSFNKDGDQQKNAHNVSSSDIKTPTMPLSAATDLGNSR